MVIQNNPECQLISILKNHIHLCKWSLLFINKTSLFITWNESIYQKRCESSVTFVVAGGHKMSDHFTLYAFKKPNESSSVQTTSVKLKELQCFKRITWGDAFVRCSLQYTWVPLTVTSAKGIRHFFGKNAENRLAGKEKQEKTHYFVAHALQAVNREGEGPERTEYVVNGRPRGAPST